MTTKTRLFVSLATIAAAIATFAAAATGQQAPSTTPALITTPGAAAADPVPVSTTHLYLAVTVWSDGSIDVADPVILTPRLAQRLTDRLRHADARSARHRRQIRSEQAEADKLRKAEQASQLAALNGTTESLQTVQSAQGGSTNDPRRCHALTKRLNRRCKKAARKGSLYCSWHQPNPDTPQNPNIGS